MNLGRILPVLGDRAVYAIQPAEVAELVAKLADDQLARESIRKTLSTLALVFDFAGRKGERNPARDRAVVQLPTRGRRSLHRRVRSMWRRSGGSSPPATASRYSFSTRPECALASSRVSRGAT